MNSPTAFHPLPTSALFAHVAVACGCATLNPERAAAVRCGRLYATRVLPIATCLGATLGLGNVPYLYLSIGFIQICKTFTPIVTLGVLAVMSIERPAIATSVALLVIAGGDIVSSEATPENHSRGFALGLACMFLSMVADALRLALTQHLLRACRFSVLEGMYFVAPTACLSMLTASALLEGPAFVAARAHEKFLAYPSAFAATVALGVVLNFASYFVISTAGALALKVLGTVRNTALVVVGVSYFHDACSGKEAAGYCISLAGSAAFLYLTHRQEVAAVAAAATTSSDASKSDANKDKGARKDESEEDEEAAEPLVGVEQNSVANVLEEGFDDIGKAAAPWSIVVVLGSLVSVQGHKEDSIDDDAGDNDT
jgi:hypothetical protein